MKRPISMLTLAAIATSGALFAGQGWARSDDQAEIQQFLNAPHSLSAAIQMAESSTGGRAYAAEFSEHRGTGVYEVETLNNDKLAEVQVDPATGTITQTKDEGLLSANGAELVPSEMPGSLVDVIAKAEQIGGGKVMSISHENEHGTAMTEIEIVAADGSVKAYTWNAAGNDLVPLVKGQGDGSEYGEANEG